MGVGFSHERSYEPFETALGKRPASGDRSAEGTILYEKAFSLRLSGTQVYYTA